MMIAFRPFRTALLLMTGMHVLPALAALPNTLTFNNHFGTMTFDRPIHFLEFPGRDSTWVVVENPGRIVIVRRQGGNWVKSTFDSLAVSGANATGTPRDGGLLGFAFHPKYDSTGRFYVFHIADGTPGAIYLVEGVADSTRLKATTQPKRRLLRLQKTLDYHNGGTIHFGTDNYLYASVGDGGFVGGNDGDPENRAQNMATVFGKMIRIDVDAADAFPADTTRNYGYPADNPFVSTAGALPEIWALGLRSPWRWSFHPISGDIWLGDVGQWDWEEVTVITKGGNAGWKVKEGPDCFYHLTTCNAAGLTDPVLSIPHPPGQGWTPPASAPAHWRANSVSGGVFYFGDTASPFYGTYFWGDEVESARIFAVKFNGTTPTDTLVATSTFPRSVGFSSDSRGRVFAISRSTGNSTPNNGTIRLVESPDMPYTTAPTRIRKRLAEKRAIQAITAAELLNNRGKYLIRGLDGREIKGIPSGTFLVIEKGNPAHRKMMTVVW
jgi:glucose/arabinose dehydrogenase